jgi:hypothetical protein
MKASNLAAYPDSLGGPWRPLDGLAYTFPAPTALAGFWRPADLGLPSAWHNRITLKGNVRGFTPSLYAYATKGIAPLTATPRAA